MRITIFCFMVVFAIAFDVQPSQSLAILAGVGLIVALLQDVKELIKQ